MDTSDKDIQFDENGICNHCSEYDFRFRRYVFTGETAKKQLSSLVEKIKHDGNEDEYNCIIGVSGGVDSSFLAMKAKQLGLKPLAVHLDNGWNSELAVRNIENILRKLDIELFTHVLDWQEFKDLQLCFLRASTPDIEIPTDHAILATLMRTAEKMKIKYILAGGNVKTECHLPRSWSCGHNDWNYIRSINRKFGKSELKNFPHFTFFELLKKRFSQKWINLLNYFDYSPKKAKEILETEFNWKKYEGKHYESVFTRFYQGYILLKKFGYDKRRCHLSSLVCSGEMTREQALNELKISNYPDELIREDKQFVIKKLEISEDEFQRIMDLPRKTILDYSSQEKFFMASGLTKIWQIVRKII
ncbi:MAG: N-acetyl sugar amidotransferase [Candidatus Riflebacteria bacterium]|nr:N-acetyl sugar amidotransferase [Candidatus Riflebacteria bacterium]